MTRPSLRFVDLDGDATPDGRSSETEVVIGTARRPLDGARIASTAELDCTLAVQAPGAPSARTVVAVPDVDVACQAIRERVEANNHAAQTLCQLVRVNAVLPVADGLITESLAYSMLLAGPEFARWRAARTGRPIPEAAEPPVLLSRHGDELDIVLNRPERHNAFSAAMRDGLVEALDLARLDPSVGVVRLRGNGASFCSGGDLDEFGSCPDVATAHLIRIERSVAARLDAIRGKVEISLHGACIGAGIELASFAGRVVARADAFFALPELAMGLVPGAGGTVGITRRIGRWRTAYLALSGERLAPATALDWGLVDAIE